MIRSIDKKVTWLTSTSTSGLMTKAFCETGYSGHKNLIGADLVNNSTLLGR
jgi:hypothetical protein